MSAVARIGRIIRPTENQRIAIAAAAQIVPMQIIFKTPAFASAIWASAASAIFASGILMLTHQGVVVRPAIIGTISSRFSLPCSAKV